MTPELKAALEKIGPRPDLPGAAAETWEMEAWNDALYTRALAQRDALLVWVKQDARHALRCEKLDQWNTGPESLGCTCGLDDILRTCGR